MTKKEKRVLTFLSIILLSALACFLVPKALQNDTYYTIKIGNYILEHGIDMKDHFALISGLPYSYPHWLYDCLVAISYNIFSFNGIYVLTMLFSVILASSVNYSLNKLYKEKLISFVMTMVVLFLMQPFLAARAQLITYSCFVLLVYNIIKFLKNKNIWNVIAMFIIGVIIANVHSAVWPFIFVLFLPFLVEQLVLLIVKKIKKRNKFINYLIKRINIEKESNIKYLLLVFFMMIITGFLTPIGSSPFLYAIKIFLGNTTASIHEHFLSVFNSPIYIITVMIPLFLFLIFCKQKIRLRDLFMILGLMILATSSRRHVALLISIGCIFITRYLIAFINKKAPGVMAFIEKKISKPITASLIAILFIGPYIPLLIMKINQDSTISEIYPIKAADYLLENYPSGEIRVFNDYNYGSYLLFRGIPPIIDSRSDLYTKPFNKKYDYFDEYIAFDANYYNNYMSYFEKYNIRFIIIKHDSYLNIHLRRDKNYKMIHTDEHFFIYERK